jgi:hypothetical protein
VDPKAISPAPQVDRAAMIFPACQASLLIHLWTSPSHDLPPYHTYLPNPFGACKLVLNYGLQGVMDEFYGPHFSLSQSLSLSSVELHLSSPLDVVICKSNREKNQ